MRALHRLLYVIGLGCGLLACDGQSPASSLGDITSSSPVVLDNHVVFVDAAQKRAYLLDLSEQRPKAETQRFTLPPQASVSVQRTQHHDEALILCAGERDSTTTDAAKATLVVITTSGDSRKYELGTTPFNALAQSDDGRYAIAYRTGQTHGRTLDNPNELIVIDLDRDPSEDGAVTRKTPAGLGHTLTHVLVSPPMTIADEERRLLVVLSAAEVSIFDLGHLDRRATIVQLDETRTINPEQVVFSKDQPTLYVRASSSDNIFMFRFEPFDNSNNPGGNDFQPSINPLSGGVQPRDVALFGSGTSERLLVLATGQVLVIDPASSKTTRVPLPAAADHILLFEAASPQDSRVQTRALLYGGKALGVTFFDPQALGDQPSDSVELLVPQQPVEKLIPLTNEHEHSVVLLQADMVTVLDLEQRTLTPISTSTQLTEALFDPVRKKLWVGPTGTPYIQSLDLATGRTGDELRLDAPILSLLPMFEQNRLLVMHNESLGYLTIVDADKPDREHALSLRGFFVNQLFDRSDP